MQEDFEEKPPERLDWNVYLDLARRRRWYFLLPLFLGWLIVFGVSWLLPTVYRSGTVILVEQPSVPQQYVASNVAGNLQDRLQSITQQILSRTRLLRIIESLDLYAKNRQRMVPDEVVERMRRDIEIELVRSSERELTAFNVYYSSENPYVAQRITSELTNLFISENLETRQQQSENTTQFLESQLEEAKRTLSQQEDEVRKFKDQHLGELPGQLQSNLQILGGLQSQLQSQEEALNRAKQQSVYLESLLGQYHTLRRATQAGDSAPTGLPAIDQELDRLKSQLAELSSRYTDRHPDVRKLQGQIAKTERMKQQIVEELNAKPSEAQTEGDGAAAPRDAAEIREMSPMVELESQLKVNRIETANRQRTIQDLRARVGEYQARLNRAPVREQQLTDLTRGYDQSRANYDSLLKKKNDSELATSLERRQQGEHFRILDPPSLPTKPYSPNRLKLCGIGLFLGLVLGAAVSAGAEVLDGRIYSDHELKKLVPVDVISEIPNLVTGEEAARQQNKAWLGWVAAGLLFAGILAGFAFSYLRG